MKKSNRPTIIIYILFAVFLLGAWEAVCLLHVWPSWVFPTPAGVGRSLIALARSGVLLPAVGVSLARLVTGFSVSLLLGTVLGILLANYTLFRRTVGAMLLGIQTIPSVCWLPLAILWFGLNDTAIIFVVIMGTFVSIALSTMSAIEFIPPMLIRAGIVLDARGWKLYRHVIFPAMLPAYLAGAKQGWSFAWRSLIAGEMFFVTTGLGRLLMFGRELNDIAQVFATMGIILLLGTVADACIFDRIIYTVGQRWGFHGTDESFRLLHDHTSYAIRSVFPI